MARIFLLLLILANILYFAWAQSWLSSLGLRPHAQRKPEYLQQQVRANDLFIAQGDKVKVAAANPAPEINAPATTASLAITTTPAPPAPTASADAAPLEKPTQCLISPVFAAEDSALLRQAAKKALPANSWSLQGIEVPGQWMIYMGKYSDDEQLARKKIELKNLGIARLYAPPARLSPGISLGEFDDKKQADKALNALKEKGVRTAKMVVLRDPQQGQRLKIAKADENILAAMPGLRKALGNREFRACR